MRRLLRLVPSAAAAILAVAVAAAQEDSSSLPDAPSVTSALERVFARPEFQTATRSFWAELVASVRENIGKALAGIASALAQGLSVPGVPQIILAVLIASLAFVVFRMVMSVIALRTPGASARREKAGPAARATSLAAEPHLRAAVEHASAGRFVEAAHALYLGVVLWLDATGSARYEESKTGGDYARELAGSEL